MDSTAGRDFFISYTAVNRAWAEWIAVQLEAAGYTTLLQAFDFRPGSDFVHQMQVATSTAERTVAVLSPAYFASEFSESEWRAAFAKDPSGELGLLMPVRVQPCDPPGLLAGRVYVDLVDADEPTCLRRLLDAVNKNRVRPTTARFPGAVSGTARSSIRFPGAGPAVSNLPPRNRNFSGRDGLMERIHGDLQTASAAAVVPTEAVHGLGGIGKTELATEYAHRFGSDYDITWWIPAEQPTAASAALAALARKLGVPEAADSSQMVDALFDALRARDRWLLIYDNAERPDQLNGLLPPAGGGHVLVTSRWQAWGRRATPLRLGVLTRPESVAFLQHRVGADDPAGFDAVADLLGDLPLALEEAAAYLEEAQVGVQDYLTLLKGRSRELFALHGPATDQEADHRRVGTVWSLSLDRVRREEPAAEALLNLCAFLAPDLPRGLPTESPEVLPGDLRAAVADPLAYNRILTAMGRYSLAALTPTTAGLHRLVQAVIRARLDQDTERVWAVTAVNLVRARFPNDSWEITTWAACERLLPQVLAVTGHAERLEVAGEAAGWLLDRASNYLRERGQYRQAKRLAERAVTVTESVLGLDDPVVASRRDDLGRVLKAMGDLKGARAQYERVMRISEVALAPDHHNVGVWRGALGNVLRDLGDLDGARTEFEAALRIGEAALGPDHREIGIRRSNLGGVLRALGDLAGARTQMEAALRISEAALGPDHREIGIRRSNLGSVLRDLGDLDGARTEFERALRIGEAALGPDHPDIGILRNNLGLVLRALGDLAGARTQLEAALRISEAALGPDHPDIGIWRSNLGLVLEDLGDLAGARTQLEAALRIGEATLGPDHPDIGGPA